MHAPQPTLGSAGPYPRVAPRWSVVIPYFNEAAFLPQTLDSLATQSAPFTLILVDNGSTDEGPAFAAKFRSDRPDLDVVLLDEPEPGQVHALARGLAAVATEFVAIADADTLYPPQYLATADRLLAAVPPTVAGFLAHDASEPDRPRERARRWLYSHVVAPISRGQAHGGGYGHCFRTAALRAAGGYSAATWPYVLKDHELIHRLARVGDIRYHPDLWCRPSTRRSDRTRVRWSLFERVLYHLTPFPLQPWYFGKFLGPRLHARRLRDTVLRDQPWHSMPPP
jgi:glycosyltransferase involved in cell wall biosynthesis